MNKRFVIWCIGLLMLADMLTCLAFNLDFSFWNYGLVIKTPLEGLFICVVFYESKTKFIKPIVLLSVIWLLAILITYLVTNGNIAYASGAKFVDNNPDNNVLNVSFTVLNRYLLFFLLFPIMYVHRNSEYFINNCKRLMEFFLWVNSFLIVVGSVFHLQVFASYNIKEFEGNIDYIQRFGYKGLLYGINEVTGVYFVGIAYAYREYFFNKKRSKLLLLLLTMLAAALTGTKGALITIALISGYYLWIYKRRVFIMLGIPVILYAAYYVITIDIVTTTSNAFNIHVNESSVASTDLLLDFLTSGRNIIIESNWRYMLDHWNVLNYLFGDGILYSETDLLDLYYCFGFGTIIYLYYYASNFFLLNNKNKEVRYVFVLLMIIATTGGHIIRSGIVPYFICLYLFSGYELKQANDKNMALA